MTISVHALAIETYVPALRSLSGVLDKGAEHARAKGIDPATLLKERLAPDMFPLSSQIQLACHHAKDGTARAAGQTPPKIEIKELVFDEHKVLIEDTIGILNGASAQAFIEPVAVGSEVAVGLQAAGEPRPDLVPAAVIWCKPFDAGHHIGVHFRQPLSPTFFQAL